MKAVYKITIKSTAYLLIVAMALLITNKVVYVHSHKLADGSTVVHAHPYNKTADSNPFKTHHHSSAEIMHLQNLELLCAILFVSLALFSFLRKSERVPSSNSVYSFFGMELSPSRAPPSFMHVN